jgi:hypothetical protein
MDLDGPAMGGDGGGDGEGLGEGGRGVSRQTSGNDCVGTTGVDGAWISSIKVSPIKVSSCGSGLNISYGEIVERLLSDGGKLYRNGFPGDVGNRKGETKESGDRKGEHGESGGVVTASDICVRGVGGRWGSSSSSSHGRLMYAASNCVIISARRERELYEYTFLTSSSSKEFVNTRGDDTG